MAFSHFVITISRHTHELGTPNRHCGTQRIQKAGYQVENVFGSVPFEHWDGNQVQIGQDTIDANADAHVEERAATMRVAIPDNGICPDRWVQK
jgi:hypothetical protein